MCDATSGADPYELLSASFAACTAMTVRFHALRRKYPLSHLKVAVSYRRGVEDGRDVFERAITLQGDLDEGQRAQLIRDANMSPVGRTLGLSADIRTRDNVSGEDASSSPATYEDDLRELSRSPTSIRTDGAPRLPLTDAIAVAFDDFGLSIGPEKIEHRLATPQLTRSGPRHG
jgi:uncharacterized OsmC-like protein